MDVSFQSSENPNAMQVTAEGLCGNGEEAFTGEAYRRL